MEDTKLVCPLCGYDKAKSSWLGVVSYKREDFCYLQCIECGSLYCNPMPDDELLTQIYGFEYEKVGFVKSLSCEDPKEPERVIDWLRKEKPGVFIDYGCGDGFLLAEAKKLGWQAIGIELNKEVAKRIEKNIGVKVFDSVSIKEFNGIAADILHLGDVIEHLTDIDKQMPEILSFLKPNGLLLAQGPLENNFNLFTLFIRLSRLVRKHIKEMAPYHVILATSKGQQILFERFGAAQLAYSISEVAWPAPNKWPSLKSCNPRSIGLFIIRRISQVVSLLAPRQWGNRYFYAGRIAAN